ncbi:hypothetical protein Clacol_001544 [Clathrus columnatus]|uniref:Uncharacterized protein n=1 Tax=Clathrus columnatus TaxID=1419009 RepID=A0AAV5A297_9AGAM|nr:hypothetical protein Clacol_001544 [Clathrus columnatus]
MPIDRLRSLITLYHNTKTMITPENLSEQIDAVFLNKASTALSNFYTYEDLSAAVGEKRRGKLRSSMFKGVSMNIESVQTWSDKKNDQEARIKAALWGTQVDGKAGLETVLEATERAENEERLVNETAGPNIS